jgi:hypothetical protein
MQKFCASERFPHLLVSLRHSAFIVLHFLHLFFGTFADGDEDRNQFVGFIEQRLQPGSRKNAFIT